MNYPRISDICDHDLKAKLLDREVSLRLSKTRVTGVYGCSLRNDDHSVSFYNELIELPANEEIGCIQISTAESFIVESEIDLSVELGKVILISKIVGIGENDQHFDCGFIVGFEKGLISILCSSFPGALMIFSPKYVTPLSIHNFQPVKYFLEGI